MNCRSGRNDPTCLQLKVDSPSRLELGLLFLFYCVVILFVVCPVLVVIDRFSFRESVYAIIVYLSMLRKRQVGGFLTLE